MLEWKNRSCSSEIVGHCWLYTSSLHVFNVSLVLKKILSCYGREVSSQNLVRAQYRFIKEARGTTNLFSKCQ